MSKQQSPPSGNVSAATADANGHATGDGSTGGGVTSPAPAATPASASASVDTEPVRPAAPLSFEERVAAACDALIAEGFPRPTLRGVRERLGGGSFGDIGPAIHRWRAARDRAEVAAINQADDPRLAGLTAAAPELVAIIVARTRQESEQRVTRLQAEIATLQSEIAERDGAIEHMERQLQVMQATLDEARAIHDDLASIKFSAGKAEALTSRLAESLASLATTVQVIHGQQITQGAVIESLVASTLATIQHHVSAAADAVANTLAETQVHVDGQLNVLRKEVEAQKQGVQGSIEEVTNRISDRLHQAGSRTSARLDRIEKRLESLWKTGLVTSWPPTGIGRPHSQQQTGGQQGGG